MSILREFDVLKPLEPASLDRNGTADTVVAPTTVAEFSKLTVLFVKTHLRARDEGILTGMRNDENPSERDIANVGSAAIVCTNRQLNENFGNKSRPKWIKPEMTMEDSRNVPSLSELVEQHYQALYRYAFRLSGSATDAEDLTQQAFLKAQRKLHQLREPSHAKSWLYSILRNTYLITLRDQGSCNVCSLDQVSEPVDRGASTLVFDEERLQKALQEMPEEYRSAVILFYFEDFSYKEIAAQLDVPIGTVMSRLARGKAYLRQRLTPDNDSETASSNHPIVSLRM